ncbi:hypothetical protein BLOT_008388 [Blomia tropicalis]|nr:hypothetical protein BLOT_008388 [Blomia tropicalis]
MRSRVRVDDNVVEEQVIGLLKNVVDDHQHREQERTTERETLRATGPLYDYAYCRLHEMKLGYNVKYTSDSLSHSHLELEHGKESKCQTREDK